MTDGTSRTWRNWALPDAPPENSDHVTVSLVDDATWKHMRSLYPGPEWFEGT